MPKPKQDELPNLIVELLQHLLSQLYPIAQQRDYAKKQRRHAIQRILEVIKENRLSSSAARLWVLKAMHHGALKVERFRLDHELETIESQLDLPVYGNSGTLSQWCAKYSGLTSTEDLLTAQKAFSVQIQKLKLDKLDQEDSGSAVVAAFERGLLIKAKKRIAAKLKKVTLTLAILEKDPLTHTVPFGDMSLWCAIWIALSDIPPHSNPVHHASLNVALWQFLYATNEKVLQLSYVPEVVQCDQVINSLLKHLEIDPDRRRRNREERTRRQQQTGKPRQSKKT